MKFSLLLASGVIVAIVAIIGVSAYRPSYPQRPTYDSNACGYDCRNAMNYNTHYQQSGARSAYGPYHSYAVRPAIYGGHGMYHYKGYARHPLPPANAHYKKVRSYATGNSYPAPPSGGHYGMRPVKALVLAPAYSGSSSYNYPATNYGAPMKHYATRSYHPKAPAYHNANGGARHYRPAAGYHASQTKQYYGNHHKQASYPKSHKTGNGGY